MFFTEPMHFRKRELSPRVVTRLVWGEKLMLSYVTIEPNAPIVPLHSHPHEQMGIVLEGKVGLTIGPETREIKKGDIFLVPPRHPSRAGFHFRPAGRHPGYIQPAAGRIQRIIFNRRARRGRRDYKIECDSGDFCFGYLSRK